MIAIDSVKGRDDSLAIGDILGTVLADATIVVGILATISPFSFPLRIVYSAGVFMVVSSLLLFTFMRTEMTISKTEAVFLLATWLTFMTVESLLGNVWHI
jgi:Ca2+/Na+ antiporter